MNCEVRVQKRFEDRVAVVTGGANGIGCATVKRLAAEGARVAIWDLAAESGRALENQVLASGGQARYYPVNVTDPEQVDAAAQKAIQTWGRVDILVNNAGIIRDAQLVKAQAGDVISRMSTEAFDSVIAVNLRGMFLCARAVAPSMIRQNYGRVINVTSIVALYGNFGQTNYAAAKAGVIGMTRVWARELGRYNITANALASGFIETDLIRQMPQKIMEMMVARTPLRRLGQPDEIASAILFLASDEASFISGAVLSVDGGMVIGT
jgi:3-oxoacyl-[acyl-carrier protein] reductase